MFRRPIPCPRCGSHDTEALRDHLTGTLIGLTCWSCGYEGLEMVLNEERTACIPPPQNTLPPLPWWRRIMFIIKRNI